MDKTSKILVTGANGHVGFNLVKTLLEDGYETLRVSVRDKDDPAKTDALKALGITDIVSLDIRDADTFRDVCAGIDILFHVAATYRFHTGSPEADAEMVQDSMDGVRAAMKAAAENKMAKVILTSSVVTLPFASDSAAWPNEDSWTDQRDVPYIKAKTEAEKLAWSMADELGVDLVTVLPGAVLGPNFGRGTQSTDFILAIMKGSMRMGTISARMPVIDVRDVVRGHILAAEKGGKGRYIIAADDPPDFPTVIQTMRKIDTKVPGALMVVPKAMYGALPFFDWLSNKTLGAPRTMTAEFAKSFKTGEMLFDNSKAKRELGWSQSVTLEQTLRDTMAELKEAA
ncbi:MAG: NAD-dependent epimerase/dehydratase family protein [Pseudomonadota bacterium]